jgi:cytochrome c2
VKRLSAVLSGLAVVAAASACQSPVPAPPAQPAATPGTPKAAQAVLETVAADGVARRWSVAQLAAIAPPRAVPVWDPQENAEVRYWAMPLPALLDALLGPAWRQASDVLGVARDGYSAPIAVSRLVRKPSWLAVARLDAAGAQQPLRMQPKDRPAIDGGPFYIIWDSLGDAAVRAEGDHGWPYQLVRIEVVDLAQRYPGLAVPAAALASAADSGAAAMRGQQIFARYCLPCHAVGGNGGRVGPELVVPVGVVHTWQPRWLAAWIDDPLQVRADAKMPRPPLPEGDRRGHIADVIAYLQARTPLPSAAPP